MVDAEEMTVTIMGGSLTSMEDDDEVEWWMRAGRKRAAHCCWRLHLPRP